MTGRRVTLYAYHAFFRATCLGFARYKPSFLHRKAREPSPRAGASVTLLGGSRFHRRALSFSPGHDPRIVYAQLESFPRKSATADVITRTLKLLATDIFSNNTNVTLFTLSHVAYIKYCMYKNVNTICPILHFILIVSNTCNHMNDTKFDYICN